MGLRQSGSPITSVPTLKGMLEMVFDVLEGKLISFTMFSAHTFSVLWYLCSYLKILHCEISKGNIIYMEEPSTDTGCGAQNTKPKEVPLCFIKYLLVQPASHMDILWGYSFEKTFISNLFYEFYDYHRGSLKVRVLCCRTCCLTSNKVLEKRRGYPSRV